jgi:hypothetical protein
MAECERRKKSSFCCSLAWRNDQRHIPTPVREMDPDKGNVRGRACARRLCSNHDYARNRRDFAITDTGLRSWKLLRSRGRAAGAGIPSAL